MKIKFMIFCCIFSIFSLNVTAQKTSITDSLVKQFSEAWNNEDLPEMLSMLEPTAFFKSPYQLRYSRDTMAVTVLITNPPYFKIIKQTENYSYIKEDLAWSIGTMLCNVFDDNGKIENDSLMIDYLYTFVKKKDEDWKLQMMIYHE